MNESSGGSARLTRRQFLRQTSSAAVAAATVSVLGKQVLKAAEGQPGRRPNILLFFPDQHRPDWLGTTPGLPVRTPNLDALGKRGVRFTHALCPSPVCAPSRAALASGREYDRCGVANNNVNYPDGQTTFYTLLRQSGYQVLGCGKFDLRKPAMSWGADGKQVVDGVSYLERWGFSDGIDNSGKHDGIAAYKKKRPCPYLAFLESKGLIEVHVTDFKERKHYDGKVTPLPDDAYCDNWIGRNGLDLIRRSPQGKPWFLQVNFNGPHEPMDVTAAMKARWKDVKFPLPNQGEKDMDHDGIRQNYSAMVENIDRWLGLYIDELKKSDQLDNTLIVYSSDHGEMLGDHGLWAKTVPYRPSAGVPLIVAGPGVRQGQVCRAPAATLDLAATFLECAGVAAPKEMDSRSLMPVLSGKAESTRTVVHSGLGSWRLAFDGRYKLVRGYVQGAGDGKGQAAEVGDHFLLFDLEADPLENANIADKSPETVARLKAEL